LGFLALSIARTCCSFSPYTGEAPLEHDELEE